ncbi:MAG: ABC transporter permease [Candidatus Limnocylindria bacterium]
MSAVAAELLKLRRSWSTSILIGILALLQLLLGYVLLYFIIQAPLSGEDAELERAGLLIIVSPGNFVLNVLNMLASLGAALALVLGAMHSAREYGWRTISTLLTQGPTRLGVFGAKLASLAIVILIMVLVAFAVGAMGATLVASLLGNPVAYPSLSDVAAGIAAGFLIAGAWATLGFALGFLLRSTGLAIGLGLVYALVIENLVAGLAFLNEAVRAISHGLLGSNGSALAASFGPEVPGGQFGLLPIDPPVASAVLAAYIVISSVAAAVALMRRDVT